MFSNIFVLYYIQLSLLKMEYRWLLYCRTEETKKEKEANCSVSPAGLWHDVQRLSLPWSERKTVDWCCLKGVLPYELLFVFFRLPWSKASFQNTLTDTAPAPTYRVDSENFQPEVKALLRNYLWNWPMNTFTEVPLTDRCWYTDTKRFLATLIVL